MAINYDIPKLPSGNVTIVLVGWLIVVLTSFSTQLFPHWSYIYLIKCPWY